MHMDSLVDSLYKIRRIANDVRFWAEQHQAEYEDYPGNLTGMCAITAAKVFTRIKRAGIPAELWLCEAPSYAHCFVVAEDHVIDVTATQFPRFEDTRIVMLHTKEASVYGFYQFTEGFGSVKDLIKYQERHKWPIHQRVNKKEYA